MQGQTLSCVCDRAAEGFKKALRKDASIRGSIPSSKTPGLNLVRGSALKKSRCFPVTMEGTRSLRAAWAIANRDCMKRMVFDASDLSALVRPIHVIPCCRMAGNILTKTSSRNHARKLFQVNGQYSMVLAFCLPLKKYVKCLFDLPFLQPFKLTTWKMYLLVGPFHELLSIAVVGPWAMISDELVPLLACSLMQSRFLLRFGYQVPNANLHPTHSIQHVVQSHLGDTSLISPIKAHTMAMTKIQAIL